jgi:hypothetical protein
MNIIYQQLMELINPKEHYLKCEKHYFERLEKGECRTHPNESIRHVSVSIILKDFVKRDYYEIDTEIDIRDANDKYIGYYRLIENSEGNFIDDYLVGDFDLD